MKITFADTAKADILAFIVDEDGDLPEAAAALDKASGGLLSEAMTGGRFGMAHHVKGQCLEGLGRLDDAVESLGEGESDVGEL